MVWIDRSTHSQRRLMRISDDQWKCWCRVCHGDDNRSRKRARMFDTDKRAMQWWREHEQGQQHLDLTAPKTLNRRYEMRKKYEAEFAQLEAVYRTLFTEPPK